MLSAKSVRANLSAQLSFKSPIFQWQQVPGRFFSAVYEEISPRFSVSPRDFSVANTTSLGEIWARFSLFGGNNSITLFADRLVVELTSLMPNDYALANEIMRLGHDCFMKAFPEIELSTIEYRNFEHLDLVGQSSTAGFFAPFVPRKLIGSENGWRGTVEPGIKFKHTSEDNRVIMTLLAEPSVLSVSSVFLAITITVLSASELPTFDEKQERISDQIQLWLKALNLDVVVDGDANAG